jgi:chromosome segregation protein
MIDEVLAATPQGRKVFFDEAAGVRALQIKKEQAVGKLDQTKENLTRIEMLVQEIEPRLRSLTRQVHKLEQRSEIETELRTYQDSYYRSLWHDVQGQLQQVRNQHQEKEILRRKLESDRSQVENDLRHEESRKTRDAEFDALQKKYQSLVDQKHALERDHAALKGKRDAGLTAGGKSNIVWLEKKRDELDRKSRDIEDEISETDTEIQECIHAREEHKVRQNEVAATYARIEQEIAALKSETEAEVTLPEVSDYLQQLFAKHERVLSRVLKAESPEHFQVVRTELQAFHNEFKSIVHKVSHTQDQEVISKLRQLDASLVETAHTKENFVFEDHRLSSDMRVAEERKNRLEEDRDDLQFEIENIARELETSHASTHDRDDILENQEKDLRAQIQRIEEDIARARTGVQQFNDQEQEKKDTLVRLQKTFVQVSEDLSEVVRAMNQYAVDIARLETRSEDLDREMRQEIPSEAIEHVKATKADEIDRGDVYGKVLQYKKQLEMIGGIDPQVTAEYEDTKQRYDFLSHQLDDLRTAIADLEKAIEELENTIKTQFTDAFQRINKEFGLYFKKLFGGGRATLELIKEEVFDDREEGDEENLEDEEGVKQKLRGEKVVTGVAIYATPPGKKLKSVGALSGGERALTSIALICAIISNNPSPFVVLDEVDAALDEANSERFASIIAEFSQHTQFITITHNRATMEHSSILYGVTMGDDGISKLLSVNVEHAEAIIKRHGNR